jgi:hypothetical protein
MRVYHFALAIVAVLPGCTDPASESIKGRDGVLLEVERYDLGDQSLPSNSDLKMVDGDIARYAAGLCEIEDKFAEPMERCDVFVQPDLDGLMTGYAVLRQTAKGVAISTKVAINPQKGQAADGCWIGGTIYNAGSGYSKPVISAATAFEGQMMYSAWERSPGDFILSEVNADTPVEDNSDGANGVWYLTLKDNKLRIAQERWNYCYKDADVDEVFIRVVTIKKSDRS